MVNLIVSLMILVLTVPGIIIGSIRTCLAIGFTFGQDFIEKRAEEAWKWSKAND